MLYRVLYLLLVLLSHFIFSQSAIRGTVYDGESADLLVGAKVSIPGTAFTSITDAEGRYEITDIPEGQYELYFSSPNYEAKKVTDINVTGERDITINVSLNKDTRTEKNAEDEVIEETNIEKEKTILLNLLRKKLELAQRNKISAIITYLIILEIL
ncbi:MAG: carboxypeptidase-like regulatory domain-containing protein [Bacteroidia bacterium]|nr:carboxypeptidase-like regulatory domain-containing protein [Bacteroidia bacterium]MDW8347737.1 carboxypeptidase-like regulatory domain-containing protein [Bacteroidia bacterium]